MLFTFRSFALIGLILSTLLPLPCMAITQVKVGGYSFEPFVSHHNGHTSGLALDLIKLLNASQQQFKFEFVLTSPKRRYLDFDNKRFDVILFENKEWGWQQKDIEASQVFLTGGEVYITFKTPEKTQAYFDHIGNQSIAAMLGYHYGFAMFDSDEVNLKQKFSITLLNKQNTIINQVIAQMVDIGVVTNSHLQKQFKRNPQLKKQLLVSEKLDQVYNHTILVRKNSPVAIAEINTLLNQLNNSKKLTQLFSQYGLNPSTNRP